MISKGRFLFPLLVWWPLWKMLCFYLFSASTIREGQWHLQQRPWPDLAPTTEAAGGGGSLKQLKMQRWSQRRGRSATSAAVTVCPR